jgi:molybdopterin synthase catalytic subunit
MMRTAIVTSPIDSAAVLQEAGAVHNGAAVLFVGTVRDTNDGAAVSGLDYTAYAGMAETELAAIAGEAAERWGSRDIVVEHRIGELSLGEVSVAIAVAHPHRGEAYEASRYIIEQLKQRLPIWKRERYLDGRSEWVQNAGAKAANDGAAPEGTARR